MTAALEPMALGRPVVASDTPATRELVEDGVTGFIVPAGRVPWPAAPANCSMTPLVPRRWRPLPKITFANTFPPAA